MRSNHRNNLEMMVEIMKEKGLKKISSPKSQKIQKTKEKKSKEIEKTNKYFKFRS